MFYTGLKRLYVKWWLNIHVYVLNAMQRYQWTSKYIRIITVKLHY